ncbi:orotate phosphoribosyltransferase [Nodosilinea sp. LEGE 06152]|uniref:orotate phosphoribosyltransferase n=1 Tax=Nodosilinea sp. LEGE 06152 TaxID=2777966 RepID=UPI001882CDD0|nr:orotate phosphoribosyltransferase [Nodosilinea sp. LEGE 06152]MBE9155521.1 orotate phosphoribosyltransferase [Nodosilinea sp. LEGE 06152]
MDELLLKIAPSELLDLETAALRSPLLDLFCRGAYQEGDFVLTSGQRSTYYINGKLVTLHPQGALLVGRLLLDLVPAETTAVAGLTLGADPLVTAVSLVGLYGSRHLFPLIIRKEAKGHGTRAYIEGVTLPPGSAVTVLEDVVTTGQSALKAVDRLQAAGYQVNQILALVDRQQGGAELYQSHNLPFKALFTIQDIQAHWATLNPA